MTRTSMSVTSQCAMLAASVNLRMKAAQEARRAMLAPAALLPIRKLRCAVQGRQASRSTVGSGLPDHVPINPSIAKLEGHYSKMLQQPDASRLRLTRTEMSRAIWCMAHMQGLLRTDEGNDQLLYAAYVDDIFLELIYIRSKKAELENPVVNTFMGGMEADGAWLALLFCSCN